MTTPRAGVPAAAVATRGVRRPPRRAFEWKLTHGRRESGGEGLKAVMNACTFLGTEPAGGGGKGGQLLLSEEINPAPKPSCDEAQKLEC